MIPEADILDQWTVISDCIAKPDEAPQALEILTTEMFSERGCRDVFDAFRNLHGKGQPTDINHVIDQLEADGRLNEELGLRLYNAGSQARAPQPVRYYAERVREHYRKRQTRDILLNYHGRLQNGAQLPDVIEDLQTELMRLNVGGVVTKARRRNVDDGFQPFPVSVLPDVMRGFIRTASDAIGCDHSFVALPMLAASSAAIGTTRKLMVKHGWFVPSILWTVVIGESGTQKSPPMRLVLKPLHSRQGEQLTQFNGELADYKREMQAFRRASRKATETDLQEPEPPICARCIVNDTTLEGLVPILQQNPRGVLLARDELVGWIGSFDKCSTKGTASADVAHWLSIYNAENVIVDRKTGDRTTLFVPHAAVSVCGGIQPGILNRVLASEHRENGLAARLLMTYPPRQPKEWRDDEIPGRVEDSWSTLLDELFSLQHDTGADGKQKSALVRLSHDAQALFREFVNQNGAEQYSMTGDLAAAWSKLEEIPARLALLLHSIRQASGEPVDPWECDIESMQAAVTLASWFKNETQRIYRLLTVSPAERHLQQVAEWIERRGGVVRARDLVTGRKDVADARQADQLIQELVTAGHGERRYVPSGERGGRPTVEFRLFELAVYDDRAAGP